MKHIFSAIGALALGAGAMYYFDPEQGRRRRALLQDKLDHISHDARDYLNTQVKHAGDHTQGLMSSVRSHLGAHEPLDDTQLDAHVRSLLGRKVSFPRAIETQVEQGRVTLRGHILSGEQSTLIAAIWAMPGIKSVDSQLQIHESPGNEPSLQGEPNRIIDEGSAMAAVASAVAVAGGLILGLKLLRGAAGVPLVLSLLAAGGAGVKRLGGAAEESAETQIVERRATPRTSTTTTTSDDPSIDRGSSVLH